jgi:hypothetical protein
MLISTSCQTSFSGHDTKSENPQSVSPPPRDRPQRAVSMEHRCNPICSPSLSTLSYLSRPGSKPGRNTADHPAAIDIRKAGPEAGTRTLGESGT